MPAEAAHGVFVPGVAMRINHLDAARSVLMSLGVVLHAAAIYDPLLHWKITDSHGTVLFYAVRYGVHVFRMPAFFMLAGFFCLLVLGKYRERFLGIRLTRLLVPLGCTALLLNTLQAWLLYRYHGAPGSFAAFYAPHGWREMLVDGRWISHLWFLIDLVIYTVLAYAAWRLLQPAAGAFERQVQRIEPLLAHPLALLLLPAVAVVGQGMAYKVMDVVHLGFIDMADLMHYALFFALGMAMFHSAAVLERFTTATAWTVGTAVLALAALPAVALLPAGTAHELAEYYIGTVCSLSVCVLVFHAFKRFASRPNKVFAYLSEASYTVYLFHHLTVIVLGIVLMHVPISVYLKFAIVVLSTMAILLAIHEGVVLRFKLLRFMFNGKYEARQAPAAAPALGAGA